MFSSSMPIGINPEYLYGATRPQMDSRIASFSIRQIIEECQKNFPDVPVTISSMDFNGMQVDFTQTRFGLIIWTNPMYMTSKGVCETSLCDKKNGEKLYTTLLGLEETMSFSSYDQLKQHLLM